MYFTYRVITIKHILRPHATNLQPLVSVSMTKETCNILVLSLFLSDSKPTTLPPFLYHFAIVVTGRVRFIIILVFFVVSFTYTLHSCSHCTHRKKKTIWIYRTCYLCKFCRQCGDSQLYIHKHHIVWSVEYINVCVLLFGIVCTSLSMQ